jgi:hypothetical protein
MIQPSPNKTLVLFVSQYHARFDSPLSSVEVSNLTDQNWRLKSTIQYNAEFISVARQRQRDKKIYKSRFWVTSSQTNMCPRQRLNNNNELRFLRGPCRGIINATVEERPSIFISDKTSFSSERMLHKDYDSKGSTENKIWSWVSRGLRSRRNVGDKSPAVE